MKSGTKSGEKGFLWVKAIGKKWPKIHKLSRREGYYQYPNIWSQSSISDYGSGFERQPMCPLCEVHLLSIAWKLFWFISRPTKCEKYIFETALKGRDVNVRRLIGEGGVVGNVIAYLREMGIYSYIWIYNRPLTLCWGGHYNRQWLRSGC